MTEVAAPSPPLVSGISFPAAAPMPHSPQQHIPHHSTAALRPQQHKAPQTTTTTAAAAPHYHYPQWIEAFASKHFSCAACAMLLVDPVIVADSSAGADNGAHQQQRTMCRGCAQSAGESATIVEAPSGIVGAVAELRTLLLHLRSDAAATAATTATAHSHRDDDATAIAQRKIVKAKRSKPLPSQASPSVNNNSEHGSPEIKHAYFHVVNPQPAAAVAATAAPHFSMQATTTLEAAAAAMDGNNAAAGEAAPLFSGVALNPNVELAAQKVTPVKSSMTPSPQHSQQQMPVTFPPNAIAAAAAPQQQPSVLSPQQKLRTEIMLQVVELPLTEDDARKNMLTSESLAFIDFAKKKASSLKAIQNRRGSSRQLKVEADELYEKAKYPEALDRYTRAIDAQADGFTKLNVLYGNRSAAFFMSGRYSDCIEDCLKVIEFEPNNVKLYQRAVKAAIAMGDLLRAVHLYDSIDPPLMTDALFTDRERLVTAAEQLTRAQNYFGKKEGDEEWQMLVAQFSETVLFRLRFAESLVAQQKFEKAIDVLTVVSGAARTSQLALLLARCMYLSGFEQFDRARNVLADYPLSEECKALMRLIDLVDDGKQRGNMLFSQRDFAGSIEHYTRAIEADVSNGRILRILYCNRAAANKELGKYRDGIDDCSKALRFDSGFSKAYARRARCHQHLNDFSAAIRDFKCAIQYDPNDHELVRELRHAEQALVKETEREKDFYYVLSIQRTATEKEIKTKYRELSLKWHPDKCVTLPDDEKIAAEKKFKVICEAYTTLIDANKRREYDLKLDRDRFASTRANTFSSNTYFQQAAAGAANYSEAFYGRQARAGFSARPTAPAGTQQPQPQQPPSFW